MTYREALDANNHGQRVRRYAWPRQWRLVADGVISLGLYEPMCDPPYHMMFALPHGDRQAQDWMVGELADPAEL